MQGEDATTHYKLVGIFISLYPQTHFDLYTENIFEFQSNQNEFREINKLHRHHSASQGGVAH